MRVCSISQSMKKAICVYSGLGAHDQDSAILLRLLNDNVDHSKYDTQYISPQQIIEGDWRRTTSLLVIGGGYDLGLIRALGHSGMSEIRDFVHAGGSYLGVCSGAYFACDRIKFDEGGTLEVVGERYLKFYPGQCLGPVYKGYDYNSRRGAVAAMINFKFDCDPICPVTEINCDTVHTILNPESLPLKDLEKQSETLIQSHNQPLNKSDKLTLNQSAELNKLQEKVFPVFFDGGGHFVPDNIYEHDKVHVLSRYQHIPGKPIAAVKCVVGSGRVVLSGVHFEYEADDIDDGDALVAAIIPRLRDSRVDRGHMVHSVLHDLGIRVCKSSVAPTSTGMCDESKL